MSLTWKQIDERMYSLGMYTNPVLKRRKDVEDFFKRHLGNYDNCIFIQSAYIGKVTAEMLRTYLQDIGYNRIMIGKFEGTRYAERLKDAWGKKQNINMVINTEERVSIKGRVLTYIRSLRSHGHPFILYTKYRRIFRDNRRFFDSLSISYGDIAKDLQLYESTKKESERYQVAKRLFGDFYYIKDFIHAEKWLNEIRAFWFINKRETEDIEALWREIQNNLVVLKECVQKKDNIVVNWIDALRHSELDWMPFVKKQIQEGLAFENMYANAPYTTAAMRSIFEGGGADR